MLNNLMRQKSKMLDNVSIAVEKTCVDVANHAKAGHAGNMAHASQRYQNQTSNLTNNILPEMLEVNFNQVHGIVPATIEYAATVEFGNTTGVNVRTGQKNKPYPYLAPALFACISKFKDRMSKILKK